MEIPFLDMAMKRLKEFALENPDRPWIVGGGWKMDWFESGHPPGPQLLDEAVPDRPVLLTCFDGHSSWANTLAMKEMNINKDTPDPAKGKVLRDSEGNPIGVFQGTSEIPLTFELN